MTNTKNTNTKKFYQDVTMVTEQILKKIDKESKRVYFLENGYDFFYNDLKLLMYVQHTDFWEIRWSQLQNDKYDGVLLVQCEQTERIEDVNKISYKIIEKEAFWRYAENEGWSKEKLRTKVEIIKNGQSANNGSLDVNHIEFVPAGNDVIIRVDAVRMDRQNWDYAVENITATNSYSNIKTAPLKRINDDDFEWVLQNKTNAKMIYSPHDVKYILVED